MRGKRSKQYKKLMSQYGLVFGFREPYQVLVDAQMVQDAERFTMDLFGGLERVLHGKIKPMITQCSIRHLYTLSSIPQHQKDALILRAKNMERRRCNHHELEQPLSTLECLASVIDPKGSNTNKNRYVVASQSEEVRRHCRAIRGVPLVYVKRSVMVMEPMAEASLSAREGFEKGKFRAGIRGNHPSVGMKRKREDGSGDDGSGDDEIENDKTQGEKESDTTAELDGARKKRKKTWGPKGPNPLSVKKSRKIDKKPTGSIEDGAQMTLAVKSASSDLVAVDDVPNIIEHSGNEGQAVSAKRKRKRKHKTKALEELKASIQENADDGDLIS